MIVRIVRDHPVQAGWMLACFIMGVLGSLIGGALGQLIF